MNNFFKKKFLLVILTSLVLFCGAMLGGQSGMVIGFVVTCFMNVGVYWFSDKIMLAMHRAQPLTEEEAPEVFAIVRRLSAKAGIPMPRLYMLPPAFGECFCDRT